MMGLSS